MASSSMPIAHNSSETRLKLVSGSFYIPKEKREKPEGDDAHFICEAKQTIGVADGVGGWSDKGIDAGIYARKLINNVKIAIESDTSGNIDLKERLTDAYEGTLDVEGSSTVCLLTLKNNFLHSANVGDSGFMIIRNGAQLYKSPVQVRRFNCPYQLGKTKDTPIIAEVSNLEVQAGDIVVLGTDGLFENLYDQGIEDIVRYTAKDDATPEDVARVIAEHAYYCSIDKQTPTPFACAAFANGREHFGGKKDDITVIVSFIQNIQTSYIIID